MSEPEPRNSAAEATPTRAVGLRLFASVIALTAGTVALVVAILLLRGVLV